MNINPIAVSSNQNNNKPAFKANLIIPEESKQIATNEISKFYKQCLSKPEDLNNYFGGNKKLNIKEFCQNCFQKVTAKFNNNTQKLPGTVILRPGVEAPYANEYLELSYINGSKQLDSLQQTDPIFALLPNKRKDGTKTFSSAMENLYDNLKFIIKNDLRSSRNKNPQTMEMTSFNDLYSLAE